MSYLITNHIQGVMIGQLQNVNHLKSFWDETYYPSRFRLYVNFMCCFCTFLTFHKKNSRNACKYKGRWIQQQKRIILKIMHAPICVYSLWIFKNTFSSKQLSYSSIPVFENLRNKVIVKFLNTLTSWKIPK